MLSISSEFAMKITIRRLNHRHICEDPGRLWANLNSAVCLFCGIRVKILLFPQTFCLLRQSKLLSAGTAMVHALLCECLRHYTAREQICCYEILNYSMNKGFKLLLA